MEPILQVSDIWGLVPFLLFIKHCYIHFKNQDLVLFLKTIFHLFLNSLFTLFFVMRVTHISYYLHTDNEVVSMSHLISWVTLEETAKQHSLRAQKNLLKSDKEGRNHSFLCFFLSVHLEQLIYLFISLWMRDNHVTISVS